MKNTTETLNWYERRWLQDRDAQTCGKALRIIDARGERIKELEELLSAAGARGDEVYSVLWERDAAIARVAELEGEIFARAREQSQLTIERDAANVRAKAAEKAWDAARARAEAAERREQSTRRTAETLLEAKRDEVAALRQLVTELRASFAAQCGKTTERAGESAALRAALDRVKALLTRDGLITGRDPDAWGETRTQRTYTKLRALVGRHTEPGDSWARARVPKQDLRDLLDAYEQAMGLLDGLLSVSHSASS